jgi:amino acid transporter
MQPRSTAAPAAGHGFGTLPVFLAGLSTILGAVMFLRFGYAVGHVGLAGAVLIIVLGHLVTLPTALALSEIATNRKVEGGGEYFIISRSFGIRIGAAIGLSLYVSQAISVAFYVIAFAEAFRPLAPGFTQATGVLFDPRMVSIPAAAVLGVLMFTRGAAMGVKALVAVVAVLGISLLLFFLGSPVEPADGTLRWVRRIEDPDPFFFVFAIVFPAFTGMTAGVGLSGDLADPGRSIPLGTISATVAGFVIYLAIAWKLSTSAAPDLLADNQLVMSQIAMWGPIIPIGLACATLSSAIGSFLVAPRTLQALARDGCFVPDWVNSILARGVGRANEPRAAVLLTMALALVVIGLGNVDFVARLISMFFMVTYGTLCSISFLEHFAANPDYRPTFRTRWYISLVGAVMCALMMFQMDPLFAILAITAMIGFYTLTRFTRAGHHDDSIIAVFLGVMSQTTRWIHIRLQRSHMAQLGRAWRPSIIAFNPCSLTEGHGAVQLLAWMCERHGVGTYVQLVRGELDAESYKKARNLRGRIIEMTHGEMPGLFVATMVSPSLRTAMAQVLQLPGVSGIENNTVLLDFGPGVDEPLLGELVADALLAASTGRNVLFLRDDGTIIKRRRTIHVWLTWHDQPNAQLMVLLAYILLGHREWRTAEITVFAALPSEQVASQRKGFRELIAEGRLPIPEKNIRFLASDSGEAFDELVARESAEADLVILGMTEARLAERGESLLRRHSTLPNVLFVLAREQISIQ